MGRKLPKNHPEILLTRYRLASTYEPEERWAELEREASSLRDDVIRSLGEASWLRADVELLLAAGRMGLGRAEGAIEACEQALATYRNSGGTGAVVHSIEAICHAVRGETEEAFEALERAYAMGMDDRYRLREEPLLASLRGDARFDDLVRRVMARPVGHESLSGRIQPDD
jgi:tetratricopeptide (TPR) repeat protein